MSSLPLLLSSSAALLSIYRHNSLIDLSPLLLFSSVCRHSLLFYFSASLPRIDSPSYPFSFEKNKPTKLNTKIGIPIFSPIFRFSTDDGEDGVSKGENKQDRASALLCGMEEVLLHSCCPWRPQVRRYYCHRRHCRSLVMLLPPNATHVSLPSKPSRSLLPSTSTTITTTSPFREKMLFLDTIGVDFFTLATSHPPIVSSPLDEVKSTVDLLRSIGLTSVDLRRICGMCPDILTAKSSDITQVLTFLTREAGVQGLDLRRVISRRPRLLVSDVSSRLRPTLYFLQMVGITDIARHTPILSCSVEEKLLPRIEFLLGAGFAPVDARAMVRRFPQLFCYSIEENLEPKFDFFTIEMGRDLKELKRFPQYFSFSLRERIKPRHLTCREKGVFLTLPALLKPRDDEFRARLEVCVGSSPPLRISKMWRRKVR